MKNLLSSLSLLTISLSVSLCVNLSAQEIEVGRPSFNSSTNSMSLVEVTPNQGKDIYNPQGFWPLLGFGFGYMGQNDDIRTEGVPTHVRFLGSYYFEGPWVAEVGGGLYNQIFLQKGGGADTLQALEVEGAARYMFGNRWSMGPVWTTLTGNNRF
jgi:hypothetical protein